MADWQSAGRGRTKGRQWLGERGRALLATLIAPPSWKTVPALTIRVGLALALACEEFARGFGFEMTVELKWPNDLMVGDRKLGGILCESASDGLLVGFGINVGQREFPEGVPCGAVSLALLAGGGAAEAMRATRARDDLASASMAQLARLEEEKDWRTAVESRLWMRGRTARVSIGAPDDGESLQARILGLADDGALLAEALDGSPLRLYSAELATAAGRVDPSGVDQLS